MCLAPLQELWFISSGYSELDTEKGENHSFKENSVSTDVDYFN